jgi:hypothetical protein
VQEQQQQEYQAEGQQPAAGWRLMSCRYRTHLRHIPCSSSSSSSSSSKKIC